MKDGSARITLVVLSGFLAITAIWGAVLVVPALPVSMLRSGPFTDFRIPALSLGSVGVLAAAAAYGLVRRHPLGPALATVAGAAIIVFELVETVVIGSLINIPPGMVGAGYVGLWLQPFYIVLGVVMVVLGRRQSRPMAVGR